MNSSTGKYIMVAGLVLIAIGALVFFFHDKLNKLGNLPGDINWRKDNFSFRFPVVTMIIVSVLLTLLVNIIRKFF